MWSPTYVLPQYLAFRYFSHTKKKGGQVRFTANQTDLLEKRFSMHKYVSPEDRKILADNLKLTDRQVSENERISIPFAY